MSIKLLALDLDGTIVAHLQDLTPTTQAAIEAATERGIKVVIATGREIHSTLPFHAQLKLDTPVICYQGAATYDPQTGQTVTSIGIPLVQTYQIIDFTRSRNIALNLYIDDMGYTENITAESKQVFEKTGAIHTLVEDLKQVITRDPVKGLIVHPAEECESLVRQLRQSTNGDVKVVRSLDNLVELTSPAVSKGKALANVAKRYGIAQSEVMAVGDQDNDIEMIEWAGLGIAMGNASPNAKAVADHIAPPISEEGVIWAIKKFILEE